jgi:ankyrin repeat protein
VPLTRKRKREDEPSETKVEIASEEEGFNATAPMEDDQSLSSYHSFSMPVDPPSSPLSSSYFSSSSSSSIETKETKTTTEEKKPTTTLSDEAQLVAWRKAVLAEEPFVEITKMISSGADLNFALRAAVFKQYAPVTDGHQKSIIEALLVHATINHLANAITSGHVQEARLLTMQLKKSGTLNQPITTGAYAKASALAMATDLEILPIVESLLAAGANADEPSVIMGQLCTPLKIAVVRGEWGIVDALLRAGANHHVKWDGFLPTYIAAKQGHLGVIKLLIRAGADCTTPLGADAGPDQGCTPLFIAAAQGYTLIAEELAKEKAKGGGEVPLHQAIASGPHKGKTPLEIAAQNGHSGVIRVLLKLSISPIEPQIIAAALLAAKENGHEAITDALTLFQSPASATAGDAKATMTDETPAYDSVLHQAQKDDFFSALAKDDAKTPGAARRFVGSDCRSVYRAKRSGLYDIEELFYHYEMCEMSPLTVEKLYNLVNTLSERQLKSDLDELTRYTERRLERLSKFSLKKLTKHIRNIEVLKVLYRQGLSVHPSLQDEDLDKRSALLAAADSTFTHEIKPRATAEMVQFLLNRGADPNDKRPLGYQEPIVTSLHLAAQRKDEGCETRILALVNAGANVNDMSFRGEGDGGWRTKGRIDGRTPLHLAVESVNLPAVKILLKANADVFMRTAKGETALQLADKIKTNGPDSESIKEQIQTCLKNRAIEVWRTIIAIQDHRATREAIEALLTVDTNLNITIRSPQALDPARNDTPLHSLLYWLATQHPHVLKIFPSKVLTEHGTTLLFSATKEGNTELVKALLHQIKTNTLNISSDNITFALYFAAEHGHPPIAEMLIDAGARLNFKVEDDDRENQVWSPLCVAAWFGHAHIIELLLRKAPMAETNQLMDTLEAPLFLKTHPLSLAAAGGHLTAVKVLLDAKANINARLTGGPNAFAYAVKRAVQYPSADALAIVALLQNKGADRSITYIDPNLKDRDGAVRNVAISDIPELYSLESDKYLARPAWDSLAGCLEKYRVKLRECMTLPLENQLNKLLGDPSTRPLIINLLQEKVVFPSTHSFSAPQGKMPGTVEAPTPAACLRELLGLVASHYETTQPPPYGKKYHEELVTLQGIVSEANTAAPAVVLTAKEIAVLEKIITRLHKMHVELLAPAAQSYQAAAIAASHTTTLQPAIERKPTASMVGSSNLFQLPSAPRNGPAQLPTAPRNVSSSASVLPLDFDL